MPVSVCVLSYIYLFVVCDLRQKSDNSFFRMGTWKYESWDERDERGHGDQRRERKKKKLPKMYACLFVP